MSNLRRVFLLITDLILVWASLLLALQIRFAGEVPAKYLLVNSVPLILCFLVVSIFWLFGLYNPVWRYVGLEEGVQLFSAITTCFVIFAIPAFATKGFFYPREVVIIAWLVALFLLGGVRFLLRIASTLVFLQKRERRVLIVGGGDSAEAVIRELKRKNDSIYWPVGIVEDDGKNRGAKIHGVPFVGKKFDLPLLIRKLGIQDVIITLPSPSLLKEVIELCKGVEVSFKTIPGIHEFLDGNVALSPVREVRIEDLLGRKPVAIQLDSIQSYLAGKTVLVTGAGGSIGSELCRQIVAFYPSRLLLLGHGENSLYEILLELSYKTKCTLLPILADIQNREKMERILEKAKPDVVFHAAAHKHVPYTELHPFEAVKNNFLAAYHLAEASIKNGVKKFIFLSTDKSVQPGNVLGATKRLAEMVLQAFAEDQALPDDEKSTQFISVRFGNVLDSRGSVIPTFRKQILMGGPVTVTHSEMTRYFMTIPEAVQLVLQAAALGKGGEIFYLDLGSPIKIFDLARQMIRLSGYVPDQDISIQIVGPRPGEKLEERLFSNSEPIESTSFEKILSVHSNTRPLQEFRSFIGEFHEICRNENLPRLLEIFRHFLPEYHPNSSSSNREPQDEHSLSDVKQGQKI